MGWEMHCPILFSLDGIRPFSGSSRPRHADSVERYIILGLGMGILFIRFRRTVTKEKRYNIPNSPTFISRTVELAIIDKMRLPLVVVMASVADANGTNNTAGQSGTSGSGAQNTSASTPTSGAGGSSSTSGSQKK
ncbi:hypothetical protein GGI35DRAFT_463786 [Trichoderma velutinum]